MNINLNLRNQRNIKLYFHSLKYNQAHLILKLFVNHLIDF